MSRSVKRSNRKNMATNVFLASISLLCYSIMAFVHSITMTLMTMPRTRSENVESSRLASKSNTDGEKERCALLMYVRVQSWLRDVVRRLSVTAGEIRSANSAKPSTILYIVPPQEPTRRSKEAQVATLILLLVRRQIDRWCHSVNLIWSISYEHEIVHW